jgi:hypothetical protein
MANSKYELGTLSGGIWKQWANAAGQDYFQNLSSGATQFEIPRGWEDIRTVRGQQVLSGVVCTDHICRTHG